MGNVTSSQCGGCTPQSPFNCFTGRQFHVKTGRPSVHPTLQSEHQCPVQLDTGRVRRLLNQPQDDISGDLLKYFREVLSVAQKGRADRLRRVERRTVRIIRHFL